jgi:hypothetical protein
VGAVTGRALLRGTLAAVAVTNAVTGLTALLAPRAFYADFPFGRGWVALLPPFNAHLTADVGAFFLAFALLLGWAAYTLERALVLPLCAAWTLFGSVHLAFHVAHLDGMSGVDRVAQTAGLVAVLVPGFVALTALRRSPTTSR